MTAHLSGRSFGPVDGGWLAECNHEIFIWGLQGPRPLGERINYLNDVDNYDSFWGLAINAGQGSWLWSESAQTNSANIKTVIYEGGLDFKPQVVATLNLPAERALPVRFVGDWAVLHRLGATDRAHRGWVLLNVVTHQMRDLDPQCTFADLAADGTVACWEDGQGSDTEHVSRLRIERPSGHRDVFQLPPFSFPSVGFSPDSGLLMITETTYVYAPFPLPPTITSSTTVVDTNSGAVAVVSKERGVAWLNADTVITAREVHPQGRLLGVSWVDLSGNEKPVDLNVPVDLKAQGGAFWPPEMGDSPVFAGIIRHPHTLSGTPIVPLPAPTATAHPRADCYDIQPGPKDPLDTRPMAQCCADALKAVGFRASAHTNATATAADRADDAVFYAAGHSGSDCPNEWSKVSTGPFPWQTGDALDPAYATGASIWMPGSGGAPLSFLAGPRDQGAGIDANCFQPKDGLVDSRWATSDRIGRAKLVVLQMCFSLKPDFIANDGLDRVSLGQEAYHAGSAVVVGFREEVNFQGAYGQFGTDPKLGPIKDRYRPYGDLWAHTFWSSLQAGATVDLAALEALHEVAHYDPEQPGQDYWSYQVLPRPGAPDTLAKIVTGG